MAKAARRGRRAPKRPAPGDVDYLAPETPVRLTFYLRHRLPVRRRPGSAIDLAELTRRVTLAELRAERARILKHSVARIRGFAARRGMSVTAIDLLGRRIRLKASAAVAERAFGTRLAWIKDAGTWRHYPCRAPRMPRQLKPLVHAVLGLDTRKPRLSRLRQDAAVGDGRGLLPSEMARLYGLDRGGRGAGQCIAIVEPAGGYRSGDIARACQAMGIAPPEIVDVNVGSGRNRPGQNPRADAEVALDIQVVAGVAPEARIVVYFTELSEPGLVAGVSRAVHGPERPNVVIITWGEPETLWPAESRLGLDPVLQDAMRLGITVLATAGDDLASERMQDGRVYVNYPASSPYVLGCGGTRIELDGARGSIVNEIVWNDGGVHGTGGGISEEYPVPAFQVAVQIPGSLNDGKRGRGVPDVAAAAAPVNGYRVFLDGADFVASGTSAVAPLWGAFIALVNARRGQPLGFINDRLYRLPHVLRPIIAGDNRDTTGLGYDAGPGWNACTGLGAPDGAALGAALAGMP